MNLEDRGEAGGLCFPRNPLSSGLQPSNVPRQHVPSMACRPCIANAGYVAGMVDGGGGTVKKQIEQVCFLDKWRLRVREMGGLLGSEEASLPPCQPVCSARIFTCPQECGCL